MKKPLFIALSVSLVLAIGLSVFLWISWQRTETEIQTGIEAITSLISINQNLNETISTTETDLADTAAQIQSIQLELDQLVIDRSTLLGQRDLYQSQQIYLTDVLNWYNDHYFFQDATGLIPAYAAATGHTEP